MLVLPDAMTHAEAPACSRMLAQAMRTDPAPQVVADASALRHFDSSVLAVLLDARREALALGKTFTVSQLPPRLRALAALYGVSELLPAA